jgi:DNA-binding Lrp family transcriptional regulator
MSVKEMVKKLGISEVTLRARKRKFEERFGIRYTVEINPKVLPFRSIIVAKLKHRPDKERLVSLLRRSLIPQFAAICNGEFNLLLYTAALSHIEYMQWQYAFRTAYEDEMVFWRPSHILLERAGVFPLRTELVASLPLEEPEPQILAALSEDSTASLPEIARRTGLPLSTVQYHFKKMVKGDLIRRFTAVMQNPPRYNFIATFMTFTYGKRYQEHAKRVREIIMSEKECRLLNRYLSVAELDGAYDAFQLTAFEDANEGYGHIAMLEQLCEGTMHAENSLIGEIVLGLPPFRSMDLELTYDETDWTLGKRR